MEEESYISRVGPWANKDEFLLVYQWLFESSQIEQHEQALERLSIWKLRRKILTPASVMSTLAILEVQLKDASNACTKSDLQAMYSNAFTKFLNYMSSIVRGRQLTSMHATARSLGIKAFLVDLRHLCTHGQELPALDMSRRTALYCMQWLRAFYWDREKTVICDANVSDVRLRSSYELEESVGALFFIYDAATKAWISGCKTIDDLQNSGTTIVDEERLTTLENYAQDIRNNKLMYIVTNVVNKISTLSNSTRRDRGNDNVYCDILLAQKYFMKTSAKMVKSNRLDDFIGLHQNLIRLFAVAGFINTLFERLVMICEDDNEQPYLREAAHFWATHMADGFIFFKEFKRAYKTKKDKDSKFNMDMAPVNTDIITDDIKKIYKEIGFHSSRAKLIFGDTIRRPWDLFFNRNYILERVYNVNNYTKDIIEKCILLADPPILPGDADKIRQLLSLNDGTATESVRDHKEVQKGTIFTVQEHILNENISSSIAKDVDSLESLNNIWSEAPDSTNWKCIPIGGFI